MDNQINGQGDGWRHRALKMCRNAPKYNFLLLGFCIIGLCLSGCGQSQESARRELAALKKDFTASEFLSSAVEGDTTAVALFLKAGMKADATDATDATALMLATAKKQSEVVKLLLENGANPNAKYNNKSERGLTALLTASVGGPTDIVEMLLNRGADPNLASESGMTPLMLACSTGHDEIVPLLLHKGADVNSSDNGGRTALMYATLQHDPRIVEMLLAKGADVHATTRKGATALDTALGEDGITLLGLLGSEVFEASADKDQRETIRLLRQAGVRPVSSFFTARVFQQFGNTLPERVHHTESAKDTRDFLFALFANFKSVGFDDQQMTEARGLAAQIIRGIVANNIQVGGMTAMVTGENAQFQKEFTELANSIRYSTH